MSRLGITFEQVEMAAEKILMEGLHPTIEKIRQALGGTGSNSTIAKHLNDWKNQRQIGLPSPQKMMVTPDPVNAAVSRVWQQIREETDKEIENIKVEAGNEIQAAQAALQAQIEKCNTLQAAHDGLNQHISQLNAEKEWLSIENKKNQQEFLLQQERYQALKEQFQLYKQKSESHLNEIKVFQKNEMERHQEHAKALQRSYDTLFAQLKEKYEDQSQFHTQQINSLKDERQANLKQIEDFRQAVKNYDKELVEIKNFLAVIQKERDANIKENEMLWQQIEDYNKNKAEGVKSTLECLQTLCQEYFEKMMQQLINQEIRLKNSDENIKVVIEALNSQPIQAKTA